MKNNIIVIMCDQLRKDCLGFYGNKHVKTPNLDALARDSVVFTRNYVANPICMPNRLSMFSGMYPRNHGLWTNGLLIRDEGFTLPHHLSGSGYQTCSIGKIHFEPGGMEQSRCADGWHGPYWGYDYVEITNSHNRVGGHAEKWFYENGGSDDMFKIQSAADGETGLQPVPVKLHPSSFIGERAVNYIENVRDKNKPFFMTVSFTDPHHPFVVPAEMIDEICEIDETDETDEMGKTEAVRVYDEAGIKQPVGSPEDLSGRPEHYAQHYESRWHRKGVRDGDKAKTVSDEIKVRRIVHTYKMIELIDKNVGKIIKTLKQENLYDGAVIVFTSDHGELLGDFGLWHKGPFFFEGLINTPLTVKSPGVRPRECEALFSAVDIAPTLCGLTGVEIPYYCDGISQADVLYGNKQHVRDNCMIEYRNGYHENDINSKVLVTDNYKFVAYQTGETELTCLSDDPEELKNIAGDSAHAGTLRIMKEKLLFEMLQTESKKPSQLTHA